MILRGIEKKALMSVVVKILNDFSHDAKQALAFFDAQKLEDDQDAVHRKKEARKLLLATLQDAKKGNFVS